MRVKAALEQKLLVRQRQPTESLAVGRPEYVEALPKQLEIKVKGREIIPAEGGCQLERE